MTPVTMGLYERHERRWVNWCDAQGIDPLTPSSDDAVRYLRELGTRFKHATVQQHRAAIISYHREAGLHSSALRSFEADRLMRELRARNGKSAGKIPLNSYNLRRIMATDDQAPTNPLKHLRDRAMFGLAGYFRSSEMFRLETSHIVSATRDQIVFQMDGKRTAIDNSAPGYAVTQLLGWLKASGIAAGLLLRNVTRGGRVGSALTADAGGRRLKAMLAEIGVCGDRYSLQSLRKGRTIGEVVAAQPVRTSVAAKQPAGVPFETIAAIWQVVPEAPQ